VAVGANRKNPLAGAERRDSGTGGFAFYGESAIGVTEDLNTEKGQRKLGIDPDTMQGVRVVPMRVHDGDDASCLNLNRAQRPRLLGADFWLLTRLEPFSFKETGEPRAREDVFRALLYYRSLRVLWSFDSPLGGWSSVHVVGDYPTVRWALGKRLGDEVEYLAEAGERDALKIDAVLHDSILQGSLIVPEDEFLRMFPSETGYRAFLIDAPKERADEVRKVLTIALRDYGLELTPAVERLAAFHAVENTYLSIFQLLGGLGLAVGSIGLGLVVLLNVLERRGELAMLRAIGFERAQVGRMLAAEHGRLLRLGVGIGVVAAVVAVLPAIADAGSRMPFISLGLTVAGIYLSGVVWIRLAARAALGGELLEAVRSE